ncbi:MAG: hypothetical protein ACTTI3_06670 [Treponema sp.]
MEHDVNNRFKELQIAYSNRQSQAIVAEAYQLLVAIAERYIKSYCKRKGCFIPDISEKAHDVATRIIDRKFYRRVGKTVESVTAYAYFDCIQEIVRDAVNDKMLSIEER